MASIDGSMWLRDSTRFQGWMARETALFASEPFSLVITIFPRISIRFLVVHSVGQRFENWNHRMVVSISRLSYLSQFSIDRLSVKILWNEYLIATVSINFELVDGVQMCSCVKYIYICMRTFDWRFIRTVNGWLTINIIFYRFISLIGQVILSIEFVES